VKAPLGLSLQEEICKIGNKIVTRKCLLGMNSEREHMPQLHNKTVKRVIQTSPTSGERTGQFMGREQ
ncbi:MAG TPA: hypothetical protein VEH06_06080, partial [Candidatus Bathyarchaeia archaeon]|nr:hypothetical protein [Candidatus Bathyarchaeia archaeon]